MYIDTLYTVVFSSFSQSSFSNFFSFEVSVLRFLIGAVGLEIRTNGAFKVSELEQC